ncbi:MAG: holo-ACP synthase [Patescibacteria group bacterium]|nr:holo-ACP synthase [Patescibacteria group bacterium]
MIIRTGIDIVHIPRFEKTLRENQTHFSDNVFCSGEWNNSSVGSLAGIFATKEAVIKALGMKAGKWQEICISHTEEGKPFLSKFPQENEEKKRWGHELSISHDGEYAIANVIFYQ